MAADMTTETTALKQQITTLKEQSAQHHALIQRLETDLLAVQGIKSSGRQAIERATYIGFVGDCCTAHVHVPLNLI